MGKGERMGRGEGIGMFPLPDQSDSPPSSLSFVPLTLEERVAVGAHGLAAELRALVALGVVLTLAVVAVGCRASIPAARFEPLTLTLSTDAEYCETPRAVEYFGSELHTDDQGNRERVEVSRGWSNRNAHIDVQWQVSGGAGPYLLTIDGENRDGLGVYRGKTGVAMAGCADTTAGTYFHKSAATPVDHRWYNADPELDSGWKTIKAAVTDVRGVTAEAELDLYVLLNDPWTMTGGETYRVYGHWLTFPPGTSGQLGGDEHVWYDSDPPDPCYRFFDVVLIGTGYSSIVSFCYETGEFSSAEIRLTPSTGEGAADSVASESDIQAAANRDVRLFVESIGQPPDTSRRR